MTKKQWLLLALYICGLLAVVLWPRSTVQAGGKSGTMCPAEFADFTLSESGFTILIRRASVTAIRPFDNPPQPHVHLDVGAQTYTVAGDLPTVFFKVACPLWP